MVSYRVEFARAAEKDLRRIDAQRVPKIVAAVEALASNPLPEGCKKLAGSERTYRIRVGDYRVLYEIEQGVLVVLVIRIRHRKDVYR
jgi:mRNA interferase RelE/StbE